MNPPGLGAVTSMHPSQLKHARNITSSYVVFITKIGTVSVRILSTLLSTFLSVMKNKQNFYLRLTVWWIWPEEELRHWLSFNCACANRLISYIYTSTAMLALRTVSQWAINGSILSSDWSLNTSTPPHHFTQLSASHRPLSHQLRHHRSCFLRSSPFQFQASAILAARREWWAIATEFISDVYSAAWRY